MGRHPVVPARRALTSGRARSYGAVAWCYDEIAALYSLGRIRRARLAHLPALRAGARVLYVGAGRGLDVRAAAALGARVTAVEVSEAMLARLRAGLDADGTTATLERGDFFDHHEAGYDFVVASFVLNVFGRAQLDQALDHLVGRLASDGRLVVSDFAPPTGGPFRRGAAQLYYWPVALAAWSTGLAALHGIHDCAALLERRGLRIEGRERFGFYESLLAAPKRSR